MLFAMPTSSPDFRFAFHNQVHALNRVRRSLGDLVVLDALPGYGKTAFLTKLKTEYETRKWRCSLIPLKRARNELDTVTAAIEAISAETIEPPGNLSHALDILLEQLQPGQPQALMFDDVQCLEAKALDWVKSTLVGVLQKELEDLTENNFLLIFSGYSICGSTRWPTVRQPIKLTAFQREAINQFIDAINISELWQQRSPNYRHFVADRIFQFSGGHPRASIGLLKELKNGWKPSRRQCHQRDLRVFEEHVEQELTKFVENLDPIYRTYLSHLMIFRRIDFATLKVVEQKYQLSGQQTDLQLINTFRQCNLLHSPRNAPGVKALDPVFRLGSLAQMFLKNPEQYTKRHQFAQKVYQDWAADDGRPYDDVIRCLQESIYHCLSRMENQRRLEEPSDFIDCLHYSIQVLNRRQKEIMDSPRLILETLLNDDEDSQLLLQKLDADWLELLNYAFISYSGKGVEDDIQAYNQTVQKRCKSLTTILMSDAGEVSGTGFWVLWDQQLYVVTCAHVLKQLQCSEGGLVKARTFGPNVQDLNLKVLWYKVPETQSDKDWSARQDIAILGLVAETPPQVPMGTQDNLLPLSANPINLSGYRQVTTFYSFGYPASKRLKGNSFTSLVFDEQVGNGFIKLLNRGHAKVEGGVSGAPLCHMEGKQLVGMIHARSGNDVVYCIPSTTILEVLADLKGSLQGT